MNEPEDFLSRWSRRKRKANEAAPEAAEETQRGSTPPESARPRESGDPGQKPPHSQSEVTAGRRGKPDEAAEPEFDLSKLPPVESITAETDIRAFFAPGVPAALTRAALRRAWAADPAIRDFVGLAEYDWDFNAAVPGFDLSPPSDEVRKMAAELFDDGHAQESEDSSSTQQSESPSQQSESASVAPSDPHHNVNVAQAEPARSAAEESGSDSTARSRNTTRESGDAASQNDDAMQNRQLLERKRGHGRALPQ